MIKVVKNTGKTFLVLALLFATVISSYAYNTKFSFDLDSGWMSHWAYSSYATKFSVDEAPVVECTYTNGSTSTFKYSVFNTNNEQRVVAFSKTGTFGPKAFRRNTTVQNYKYKLGVKRDGGSWHSSANTQGQWNIDSY